MGVVNYFFLGRYEGAILTETSTARIPTRRPGLVGYLVRQKVERHPGGRDGFRQDDSDDRIIGSFGVRQRQLGSASDRRSDYGYAELGNGIQEMVSWLQDFDVLRVRQRAERKTSRKCFGFF